MASLTEFQTFVKALNTVQASGPLFHMIEKLSDGVHETSPTLQYMQKNAKRDFSGADVITWNNISNTKLAKSFYGGSDVTPSSLEFLKQAVLPRAYYEVDVSYYLSDIIQNQGTKDKFVDYVGEQLDIARKGMAMRLALDLFGNGTVDANGDVAGGTAAVVRPLVGLGAAVEYNPSGGGNTYAGITRSATTTYWNNQTLQVTNLKSLTWENLKTMQTRCSHLGMGIDLIVASDAGYRAIWLLAKAEGELRENKQATELGFPDNISFGGAAIIPEKFLTGTSDGGYLSSGDVKRIYFLNTKDSIQYKVDPKYDMTLTPVQPEKLSFTQYLVFSGQVGVMSPRINGCIWWS